MAATTETFHSVGLSESKRPLLLEGEVENLMQDGIAIYEGDKITKYEKGIATLTTHRLIWMDEYHKLAPIAINLGEIQNAEADSGFKLKGSPKINFTMKSKILIKFSFRNGGRDPFFQKLQACLSRKAWEVVAPSQTSTVKKPASFDSSKAGIGGLMRLNEQKAKETEQSLQEAFTDINALIQKAKDMVALAEKFKATAAKDQNQEEDSELRAVFLSMGIASPVTKESAGSMYHTQLSRQLADWLKTPLERFGGMIAMTDLYCLVNRARGTELISPEDLYRACVLFEELKLPVRLRRFESGVLVIQSLNQTDEAIAKQIEAIVKQEGPQTSFDIARNKNISIALANEQLLTAERLGVVCRDETFDGITFYLNFFVDRSLAKGTLKKAL